LDIKSAGAFYLTRGTIGTGDVLILVAFIKGSNITDSFFAAKGR